MPASPRSWWRDLLGIIKDIKERRPTSVASVSVNGDWLFGKIGPDVLIFQGSYSFIDDEWAGEVTAYRLNQDHRGGDFRSAGVAGIRKAAGQSLGYPQYPHF